MTKIRIASDLHLEAYRGRNIETLVNDVLPIDQQDAESILVLAGDISSDQSQLLSFLFTIDGRFKKVIYIPGNHEYYRHNYDQWNIDMFDRFSRMLTNTVWAFDSVKEYVDGDVRFIFGTMWADGGKTLEEQAKVGYGLNDFRVIRKGFRTFSVPDMMAIFAAQKQEIQRYLLLPHAGKTVVITHHIPSYRLCHPRFGNEINGGFAGNCDDILAYDHAPDIWIHGHTHDCGDGTMWNTRIIANPMGYPYEFGPESEFNNYKVAPKFIEV